ncbi:MAG: hypothetical protein A3I75_06915 [Deltaproteobacteria bacterium RIFCSPLOWO2_02_FULL_50_16]|nr:MAG: hypothetical protein A2053_05970 [Deltaproteobacteria bacterium GWA2_50_8]OGQ28250.1 MAG: hypothetical protein A3B79_02845 [Deltaproteobacteria bacterium RIFCSPHIGHO2_02_FULL_50_15]OGQ57207.1 MAG: hypothetical protein A3I75_06915 [Deltaproteobacteria bacterium RIFCSPLOWO2_02_FULL_50_16]
MKFNLKAFALAGGVLWGVSLFLMTLINLFTRHVEYFQLSGGWGGSFLAMMASFYPGYSATPLGLITGTVYGFVDGCLTGLLFAWAYNFLSSRLTHTIKM